MIEKRGKEDNDEESISFPNGKKTMVFEEFIDLIKSSQEEKEQAEILVHAFSMFDRKK